jgi:hypothetical protein
VAKILRDLLDAEEPLFGLSLQQLERASGRHGTDAELIGEMSQKLASAKQAFGLDATDTTDREFYAAMLTRVKNDNDRVTKLIGGDDADDVTEMVPRIVAAVEKMDIERRCWVLKRSVAKRLLMTMPPHNLMRHLGYRTIDSMLKHEPIDELYTALRFSEGPDWLNAYNELMATVTPSDFESRDIAIVIMDHDKYVGLAEHFVQKKLHNITHTKEMGTIVVVPMKARRMKGITLKSLPLIFHYINEIRLYSSFFKLKQVERDFGRVVVETLIADPAAAANMAGVNVHWRVIQRYFGKFKDEHHPEAFQPHVHPEDLHWRRAEALLAQLDPEMAFWVEMDYVGEMASDGQPITLNLMDVSLSYSNSEPFQSRYYYHFRESLWNELFMRYMGQKNLETSILTQLDNDMIAPEKLPRPKASKREIVKRKNRQSHIEIRQKMIDAAEGRLRTVSQEFTDAFDLLDNYERAVTVFGSARLPKNDAAYRVAYRLASRLASEGYAVVTGGGGGLMQAANQGAIETGGDSIGFNINLPTEQFLNDYTTASYEFEHFFSRKVAMTLDMSGYVYLPGGFGTFDELFEIVTLQQTGKIPRVPIILFGTGFWRPLVEYLHDMLQTKFKTITAEDLKLLHMTDSVDDAIRLIKKSENLRSKAPQGSMPHAKGKAGKAK